MADITKEKAIKTDTAYFSTLKFRNVGPTRGGRVTTVAGVEEKPGTFYMGSTGGGVWKTDDYGVTYHNLSDGYFSSPSIGAIAIYQKNPKIIYVGTGSDGLRSNVIAGKGVYKSNDGGKSWEHIGLPNAGLIGAVEVHPDNPEIAFVAAIGQPFQPNEDRGVYKTVDGGKNWDKVLFHSDTVGAVDLEFAPDNSDIVYTALWRAERKPWTVISGADGVGGVYKSTDGGKTWEKKTSGLPTGLIGKIDLAVSKADPNRLYALVEAPGEEGGLYRSNDRGESFEFVSNKDGLLDRPFYYTNIESNPKNADVVFSMSTRFYKSADGGKNWKMMRTPHGDNHDIWIHPQDTSLFIQANDGGVNVTTNGGKTWSSQHNQSTAELYQVEVDDQYPYWLYAGQQDNTTIAVPSVPPYSAPAGPQGYWLSVGGCETGPAVPKPGDPNIVFSNCKGRFGVYDKRTGQEQQFYVGATNIYGHSPDDLTYRFQRVSPVHVSPHDPNTVYHTSQYVHRTKDNGITWEQISPDLTANEPDKQVISGSPITRDVTGEEYYSTIYEINESPLEKGVIWVGANDGPIHVTRNDGKDWKNVTPEGLPEGGRVDCIDPSPHQPGKAYASILRYQLGDWHPYIFKTEDYGESWALITNGENGIPQDFPTRTVREDPDQEGVLYAGTEYGLFLSLNDGKDWQPFQQNLPITPITDIKVFRKDLILSTMGRGFWIMDNISPVHQIAEAKNTDGPFLYQPKDSYRFHYRANGEESTPHYPDAGLALDYFLPEGINGKVGIEIVDGSGEVVRSFTSKEEGTEKEESDMSTNFYFRDVRSEVGAEPGLHRFQWDLKYPGPWDEDSSRAFQRGPMVAPGKYQARLTVNGKTISQSFEVMADPRLEDVSQMDMEAQVALVKRIVELESAVKKVAAKLKERKNTLSNDNSRKAEKELEKLDWVESQLETAEGTYRQPMLIAQLGYLRSMLERADQRPGKDAYDRYEELSGEWEKISSDLDEVNINEAELGGMAKD
ncbi:hypothetical protein DN752_19425 [Echinicola strongylocentroti]|uniref:Sortilin N-terminal domain-containing protein n=2 Tax=Echinicola strongylocentroti TaxID=1795355 RepID=A0A2Z4IMR9_9BACT|nr:hypothetical protein DN752_19425 [Echinicola strongylocentroti]